MALDDVTEQTQSLSQSIINSDEPSVNEVVKPNAVTFTSDPTRQATLRTLGFAGDRRPSNIYRRGSHNSS